MSALTAAPPRNGASLGSPGDPLLRRLLDATDAVEAWGWSRRWHGSDPYEGLRARGLGPLRSTPLGRRLAIQAFKRSPVDLRLAFGIEPGLSAASVGQLLSAYSRHDRMDDAERTARVGWAVASLDALRCPGFPEPCWGYHFDVETRVFGYRANTPNTIATAFAGFGLLDAFEELGDQRAAAILPGVTEFFMKHMHSARGDAGPYFGYLPGDANVIHNANLLACAFLARYAAATSDAGVLEAVEACMDRTLAAQRPDGSWPYGERADLAWVDNHHTGYVLDSLMQCAPIVEHPGIEPALARGLAFYAREMFDGVGRPRFFAARTYPIDGLCVAQSLLTLSLASRTTPSCLGLAARVLEFALDDMRRPDGAFVFQRHRLWTHRIAHVRWVEAPMLHALVRLERAAEAARSAEGDPG